MPFAPASMLCRTRPAVLATALCGLALLGLSSDAWAQSRYGGPGQAHPTHVKPIQIPAQVPLQAHSQAPSQVQAGRYGPGVVPPKARTERSWREIMLGRWAKHPEPTPAVLGQFQRWMDWEPEYTLVPGDQLDIVVASAPELSRTLTVGPDGRVVMPMTQPIMAAGNTFGGLQAELMAQLGQQLRDPRISVTPRAYAPEQIFVGGQVGQPGTYTLSNRIGALEAIFMAGGLRPTARTREVAVLRRAPNGGMMLRTVDLKGGLNEIGLYNDTIQLRRGDIVFVPASTLAEVGQWVQNFRNTLPVDFNLSYQFGAGGGNGTTVITP
ncbi:MAG: polysaccharide biosynthesis/export family protein [Litorimonas sp.]